MTDKRTTMLIAAVFAAFTLGGCAGLQGTTRAQVGATPVELVNDAVAKANTAIEQTAGIATVEQKLDNVLAQLEHINDPATSDATRQAMVEQARAVYDETSEIETAAAAIEDVTARLEQIAATDAETARVAVQPIRDLATVAGVAVPGAAAAGQVGAGLIEWGIRGVLGLAAVGGITDTLRKRKRLTAVQVQSAEYQRKREQLARIIHANEEYDLIKGGDEKSDALRALAARWAGPEAVAEMKAVRLETVLPVLPTTT